MVVSGMSSKSLVGAFIEKQQSTKTQHKNNIFFTFLPLKDEYFVFMYVVLGIFQEGNLFNFGDKVFMDFFDAISLKNYL